MGKHIHLIGFGSQGAAWAQCLRLSGWSVHVYLARKSESYTRAEQSGFAPRLLKDLPSELKNTPRNLIAFLTPDDQIGPIYRDFIAPLENSALMILAHGYAVYSGDLVDTKAQHQVALLAPKAIGPKLLAAHKTSHPEPHRLAAAFYAPAEWKDELSSLAYAMGFSSANLIPATFEQETIGDLISEQGLLCGGVFTFLAWTMEEMERAGVPDRLIREECLTELELIAGMLREAGPASTLRKISQAAQAGTIAMNEALNKGDTHHNFSAQIATVTNKEFISYFRDPKWRESAKKFQALLQVWEDRLK